MNTITFILIASLAACAVDTSAVDPNTAHEALCYEYPLDRAPSLSAPKTWTGRDDMGQAVTIMSSADYIALKASIYAAHNWQRQAGGVVAACRGEVAQ